MFRHIVATLTFLLSGVISVNVNAQSFHQSCAEDIEFYCQDVAPGDGRIAACLYAHGATLSDQCFQATDNISRIMEGFFDRLEEAQIACSVDVQKFCASEEIGDGRLYGCLIKTDGVSEQCKAKLERFNLGSSFD